MKRPDDDVWLADGHGFMVGKTAYNEHLESAVDIRQVNFLAFTEDDLSDAWRAAANLP